MKYGSRRIFVLSILLVVFCASTLALVAHATEPLSPRVVTVKVVDKDTGLPVEGARVRVYEEPGSTLIFDGLTDAAGETDDIVCKDNTQHSVTVAKSGYNKATGSFDSGSGGPVTIVIELKKVGGIVVPFDKLGLVAPYMGFASLVAVGAVVATVVYKRKK